MRDGELRWPVNNGEPDANRNGLSNFDARVGRTLLSDAFDVDFDFAVNFPKAAHPQQNRAREGHDFSRAVLVWQESGFQPLRCALEADS